jgi:hypothetical protein
MTSTAGRSCTPEPRALGDTLEANGQTVQDLNAVDFVEKGCEKNGD